MLLKAVNRIAGEVSTVLPFSFSSSHSAGLKCHWNWLEPRVQEGEEEIET